MYIARDLVNELWNERNNPARLFYSLSREIIIVLVLRVAINSKELLVYKNRKSIFDLMIK